ncbi:MAG: segregation/condensation protein A [bacterium]|nr:segregation/condensation protein A [bacterium]
MTTPEGNTVSPNEPQGSKTAYRLKVGEFDGPLDLLLHLVRVNEVDITDIPIVSITEQYNAYLEMMQDLDLEQVGDYLLMAATLMHIKSRMLLPPDPEAANEDGDEDPRAELAQQLLEYQRFKQAAETLQAMDSRRNLVWTREIVAREFAGEELLAVDMFDLLKAFRVLLGRMGDEKRFQLKRDTVSVAEKINWLTDLLERRTSIDLLSLLTDLPTRLDKIATFLAVLEMMRLQLVAAFQRKLFDEIRLARVRAEGEEDGEAAPSEEKA